MSRTGNIPIEIPEGVDVSLNERNVIVKDKSGEKKFKFSQKLEVTIENKQILIKPKIVNKKTKMIWGTTRSILNSIILGCINDFKKTLKLVGTGYRAQLQGKILKISAGYSHDIDYQIPEGINIKCQDANTIEVSGSNKTLVGQVAANIRSYRKPEPYKGKGIKYEDEYIFRKEGKKK
ncbi:MAG: 50S ribosomal protein L6 [Alphaproteobacteria bacterium MarineAlpha6_Bin4]|nr:MAG: 50S ribosomal protein L6 [Alphaproteobacteria bacterium MarineAlpha6_Bin3]PPR38308.1 MAG: 50S ribosomal protein L6 [Alphaproteobacteria bacterium MarineAlpha6_Bin4]|tara:strand:+ start:19195 stop:19728 length:534 start_codon:yes stop_codon:yes gene_type:complete